MKAKLSGLLIIVLVFSVAWAGMPIKYADAAPETIATLGDTPSDWASITFTPYTWSDGSVIYDPAEEPGISPDDVDFTSGPNQGTGDLPSFYIASDSTNLFFRIRLKGDPYDRKGGFLSSVWHVQLGVNGEHKATIGVNGKPVAEDYIYIADSDGTSISYIYKTAANSSPAVVPGTRISPAENGQYFLDFQVPVARITDLVPEITPSAPIQLHFATSKAANLSVVNKDGKDNFPFTGKKRITAEDVNATVPAVSVFIDGGPTAVVNTTTPTITGTIEASGNSNFVDLQINGSMTSKQKVSNDGTWSIQLTANEGLTANTGPYTLTARLYQGSSSDTSDATDSQQIFVVTGDDSTHVSITSIDGDVALPFEGDALPRIEGASESGNTVKLLVDGVTAGVVTADELGHWDYTLEKPLPLGSHTMEAQAVDAAGNTAADTQVYEAVDISIGIDNGDAVTTVDPQPTLRGSTNVTNGSQATISLTDINNLTETHSVTVENGRWVLEYPLDQSLEDGSYTLKAVVSDAEDNQMLTVDTRTFVTLDSPADQAQTTDFTPTLAGKAEEYATVTLDIDQGDQVITVTADGQGDWEYTPTSDLTEAAHSVTVVASDVHGNEAETSGSFTVTATLTPTLTVANPVIHEAAANDGGIAETQIVTIRDAFFDTGLSEADVTVHGLPAGLDVEVVRNSDAQMILRFTGQAQSHANGNDVSGVSVVVAATGIVGGTGDVTSDAFAIDFADPANAAPVLVSTSPADDAVGVNIDAKLMLEFNEAVTAAANKQIWIKNSRDDSVVEAVYAEGAAVTINGSSVTINPTSDLAYNTGYYVELEAGAFEDDLGAGSTALSGRTDWNFTTGLTLTPVLTVAHPVIHEAAANDGGLAETQVVTISHGVFAVGLTEADVTVYGLPAGLDVEVVRVSDTQMSLSFTGQAQSHKNGNDVSNVSVIVAASGIAGGTGDVTSNPFAIDFADPANAAPILLSTTPADDSTNVRVDGNLMLEFSEDITVVPNKQIVIRKAQDDTVVEAVYAANAAVTINGSWVTIDPAGDLSYSTEYYVEVEAGAFQDGEGAATGAVTGQTAWSFTTEAANIPSPPNTPSPQPEREEPVQAPVPTPVQIFIQQDGVEGENRKQVTERLGGNLEMRSELFTMNGQKVAVPEIVINKDGQFDISGIPPGEYRMALKVMAPTGEILAGNEANLTISESGEASIETELIDPFGTITDAMTMQPIDGVDMRLYWADTELNRSKNRVPNSLVGLPELPDFAPNLNHNPQTSRDGGQYAWMVFPDGDYYLIGQKEGFEVFDSREDTREETFGDTSYVRNGIIHVGETIVQYSFSLQPEVIASGEHDPYMRGYPDGSFRPEGNITRAEFAAVLSRILALKDDPSLESAHFTDVSSAYWSHSNIARVSEHGIMQGYTDGTFRPNAYISRAEIAAVLDQIKERIPQTGVHPDEAATLQDITGHWAEEAIRRVVQEGIFSGYPDGRFLPDQFMTRAEAVTVVNQLLGRMPWELDDSLAWPDAPTNHWAYRNIMEASHVHGYETFSNGLENWKDNEGGHSFE